MTGESKGLIGARVRTEARKGWTSSYGDEPIEGIVLGILSQPELAILIEIDDGRIVPRPFITNVITKLGAQPPKTVVEIMNVPDESAKIIEDLRRDLEICQNTLATSHAELNKQLEDERDSVTALRQQLERKDELLKSTIGLSEARQARIIGLEQRRPVTGGAEETIKAMQVRQQELVDAVAERDRMIEALEKMNARAANNGQIQVPKGMRLWPGRYPSLRGIRVGDAFKFKKPPPGWTSESMCVVKKLPGFAAPQGWDYLPIELLDGEIEMLPSIIDLSDPNQGSGLGANALIRRVTSATKHGPNGSGEPGPCDSDCLKCEAEQWLKPRFSRGVGDLDETCMNCGKHIRDHYGGTEYRCEPK